MNEQKIRLPKPDFPTNDYSSSGIQYGSGSPVSAPPDYHDQTGISQTQPATSPDAFKKKQPTGADSYSSHYNEST